MGWRRGSSVMLVTMLGVALASPAAASTTRASRHHSASASSEARREAAANVRRLLNPSGHHIYPAPGQQKKIRAALDAQLTSGLTSSISFRGGPVMVDGVQEVPIFWLPDTLQDGITAGFMEPGYQDGMVQFLNDMDQSRWMHTLTQYYGTNGSIKDASGVLQAVVDTSPYPDTGSLCAAAGHPTNCISDSQVRAEVSKVRASNNLPGGLHTMYPVFTARDETVCFSASGTSACSSSPNLLFCGYHDAFTDPVDHVTDVYSSEPYVQAGGCDDPDHTFHDSMSLDVGRSILGHEVSEAMTDPIPHLGSFGWVDGDFQEVADLCSADYGPDALSRIPGFLVNQVWNGHPYVVQRLYDLSGAGCGEAGPVNAGGIRFEVITGAWTTTAIGTVPSGGMLVSKHANNGALNVTAQAASPDGSMLYLLDHASNSLVGVDGAGQGNQSFQVPIPGQATSIALTPDGQSALIPNGTAGTITTVDLRSGATATWPGLDGSVVDVAVTADGNSVWVAGQGGLLHLSLPGFLQMQPPIPLPGPPSGLALSPSGTDAYVSLHAQRSMVDIILATGAIRWSKAGVSNTRPAVTPSGQSIIAVDHDTGRVFVIRPDGSTAGTVTINSPISVTTAADGNAYVLAGDDVNRVVVPVNPTTFTSGTPLRAEADSTVGSPISSQPPVARFTTGASSLGQASVFDGSASTAEYGIASYRWTFGDGSTLTSTTPQVTHTYTRIGTFTVTLTVTDKVGASTTGTDWDGHEYLRQAAPSATQTMTTTVVPASTPRLLVATTAGLVPVYESGPSWVGTPLGAASGHPLGDQENQILDFAVSADGTTAYVVTPNQLRSFNTTTGAAGPTTAFLREPAVAIALAPDGSKAYVLFADGRSAAGIIPVSLPSGAVGPPIVIGDDGAFLTDLVVSPDGNTAWATDFLTLNVYPVTLATGTVGAPTTIGNNLEGLAITPDGSRLLVPAFYSGEIDPVATATGQAGAPIPLPNGWYPQQDAVTRNGATLLVTAADTTAGDGTTSLFGINLPNGNVSPAVAVPRTNSVCANNIFHLCTPARVTISAMPDAATAYAGVTADGSLFPISVPSLALGQPLTLPGQLGVARPVPAQSPTARFKTSLGKPGKQSTFNGGGSTSPNGTIVRWDWDFGDGQTLTTTTNAAHHTYTKSGTYTVTLTVTDSSGVSTTKVWDGRQFSRNGSGTASATLIVKI